MKKLLIFLLFGICLISCNWSSKNNNYFGTKNTCSIEIPDDFKNNKNTKHPDDGNIEIKTFFQDSLSSISIQSINISKLNKVQKSKYQDTINSNLIPENIDYYLKTINPPNAIWIKKNYEENYYCVEYSSKEKFQANCKFCRYFYNYKIGFSMQMFNIFLFIRENNYPIQIEFKCPDNPKYNGLIKKFREISKKIKYN